MSRYAQPLKALLKKPLQAVAAGLGRHRFNRGGPALWVLMYHRVLPVEDARYAGEEPGMIVTPSSFRQQLQMLKRHFTLLPLSEWVARRQAGKPLPDRACAVTFDDGWRDNHEYALPILQAEQVPATVFAVAEMIGTDRQFWPNRLMRALVAAGAERQRHFDWLPELVPYAGQDTLSRDQIAGVVASCKRFTDESIEQRLDRIEPALSLGPLPPVLMDWPQLRAMQDTGLVEIGSHTCNHRRLVDGLDTAVMEREIVASQTLLTRQLERPVPLFCYPNGDVSAAAAGLVNTHYQAAVTTRHGINGLGAAAVGLARLGIHEDISNTPLRFSARLSGWV